MGGARGRQRLPGDIGLTRFGTSDAPLTGAPPRSARRSMRAQERLGASGRFVLGRGSVPDEGLRRDVHIARPDHSAESDAYAPEVLIVRCETLKHGPEEQI